MNGRAAAVGHGGRMARFGAVGVINTLIDFAAYAVFHALGAPPLAANVVAFGVANGQSYLLNAWITFRDEGRRAPVSFGGYAAFAAAHVVSLVISSAMIFALTDRLGAYGAKAAAAGVTFVLNYGFSAALVFRRRGLKPPPEATS